MPINLKKYNVNLVKNDRYSGISDMYNMNVLLLLFFGNVYMPG